MLKVIYDNANKRKLFYFKYNNIFITTHTIQ